MPSASGTECIRALLSLGWTPLGWTDDECQLEKGILAVTVPRNPELSSARVAEIVEVAGEAPIGFVAALERLRT